MKTSAGLLLYRLKGEPQVLIAHMGAPWWAKKDKGAWTLPKGEYEDEHPKDAARREFAEELGHAVPDGEWLELGTVKQKNNKQVVAWAIEGDLDAAAIRSNTFKIEWPPRSGKTQEFPEIDRAAWLSLPEAATKLIPEQVEFLKRLANHLNLPFGPEEIPEPPKQNSLF
jgi:predicted NUDIX family NTP pyrophosphohydrolase